MKLIYDPLLLNIDLQDAFLNEIVIEKTDKFAEFVLDLYNQSMGKEGYLKIFDDKGQIKLKGDLNLIFNPVNLNLNSKKFLYTLYNGAAQLLNESSELKSEIMNVCIRFFETFRQNIDHADITYELEPDFSEIFKAWGLAYENESERFEQRLFSFLKLYSFAYPEQPLVFIQLRDYLDSQTFKELLKMISYLQITVILIETKIHLFYEEEKVTIVDNDLCLIN